MVHRILQKELGDEVCFALYCILICRPKDGVLVYPEGHRYTGKGTLPLKTGALESAYNLNVPCQIVLSLNKVSK